MAVVNAHERVANLSSPATGAISGTLLVVSRFKETAERIESTLRNAGHPLRVHWLSALADIEEHLRSTTPDVLLADAVLDNAPPDRVILLIRALRPDVPVILVGTSWSLETSIEALTVGAQDVVVCGDARQMRHLELVVTREFIRHHYLRQLRSMQMRLGDFADALGAMPEDTLQTRGALLLHIDDFESLENRVGHADAQAIKVQITALIQQHLGADDQLFAFAADEIALIVHHTDLDTIERLGDVLRKEVLHAVFSADEHEAQVSLSIALFPLTAGDHSGEVIRQLTTAARRLSSKGGNQIVVLNGTTRAGHSHEEDQHRAMQVRKALQDDRFTLAYQSIASLEGDTRSYHEILLRMIDEQGHEHYAAEFLPHAARFNLMRSVDRWVVGKTLDIIARRTGDEGAPPTLFVKLSEDSLRDGEAFVIWLRTVTRQRPMKREEIVFQIPELLLQNHIRKSKTLTETLSIMGAGIAIEHFGIGLDSIQLLDHVQASYLKFHPSFTQNFADKATQKHLQELVEAAKQRKISTIVSHVEDADVMAKLWQMGVNFIQGYRIKEPEVVHLTSETAGRR